MNPTELANIIKNEINSFIMTDKATLENEGVVIKVADGIARVYGLNSIKINAVVEFDCPSKTRGLVLNLEKNSIGVVIIGSDSSIKEGDKVRYIADNPEVYCGKPLLGRVVDGIGRPIDGLDPITANTKNIVIRSIESPAPDIISRRSIHEPMYTGIKAIDSLIPVGKGQRELIIGDRQTGKTSVAISAVLNQKKINEKAKIPYEKIYCIYVCIGQKMSSVAKLVKKLTEEGAMEYTTVVVASASDPAPMQFLAPYTGCTIGEYFRDNGMHSLVIYDDLSKHAVAYRQMSLLLRRPPGREAYPGDIFFIHSRLLERAAKMSDDKGGGSLTALPIIETSAGDVSAYIPTNVISITDGQIFLETELFNKGIRPAINIGISVSRVSSAAQDKAIKQVSGGIKLDLAQYREMESFSQMASDLDISTQNLLQRGRRLTELLKQDDNETFTMEEEVIALFIGIKGYLEKIDIDNVLSFVGYIMKEIREHSQDILDEIYDKKAISKEIEDKLHQFIENRLELYNPVVA
ncbi:F0F1 ATP synthase subunit alpha [Lyticum sinuosum]|uniref:ATP synthase subunit alpha n=1 Tax=Lyticum sinuosum TaxID=1332059 RepID=A0AAE4VJV6_9RICK|nr:F0F1 ATP synthase subunit alpha [Lyticum sinuosum]MDZ5761305.1 ATP synthase subunit alpha [Lyticum sinuosum]